MPEGRSIVNDCQSEYRRVSDLIDYYLKPLASKHDSYIKDSFDFLNKIRNKVIDNNFLLVSGDITSLYTNMHIKRSLAVVKRAFSRYPSADRPDQAILDLLELTLNNNDFSFNNEIFLQIFGTAMGKSFAPSLANLYLLNLDNQAINGFKIKPLFFRFLDDIFFVWPGSREDLDEYFTFLNSIIPNIKITFTVNTTHINFLDLTIFKHFSQAHNCTTLQSKVYFKPTDSHILLHSSSFHPPHTFISILKSQILRFKRLSSFQTDFDNSCNILFTVLGRRGYNRRLMRKMKHDIWFGFNNRYHSTNKYNRNSTLSPPKPIIHIVIPYSTIATQF